MFGRNKKPVEPDVGRRRQAADRPGSSPAFSYYSSTNRTLDRSPEAPDRRGSPVAEPAKRRRLQLRSLASRLPLILVVVAVGLLLFKVLTLSSSPRVVVVGQDASYIQESGVYAQAAQKLLATSKLNAFKPTADLNGVAKRLQTEFPELQTVSITAPLVGSKPIVYVMPAQSGILLQVGDTSYAVNGSGVVLAEVADPSKPQGIRVIDQAGVQPVPGKRILPASTISFLQRFGYQLQAKGQAVDSMTLPAANPYEVDVRLTGKPYFVKTNVQGNPVEQAGTVLAVQNQVSPAEYLDVRVPGRVYYK